MTKLKRKLFLGISSIALVSAIASCANSQIKQQFAKQGSNSNNLENKINYNYIDTIKSSEDLKKFENWMDSIYSVFGATKEKPLPNYLEDSNYNYNETDLKKFNSWVTQTISESKQKNKNSIIINKSEYALYLIKSGKVFYKYSIELGFNPCDDKQKEGDGCTPEGIYKVTWKRDIGQTVFYRAFLIDYPNSEDRKKGKTGGMIEIHGGGSGLRGDMGGYNWTLGCIALSNEDIDEIFPYINENSRVTIVKYTNIDLDSLLWKSTKERYGIKD